MLHLWLFDALNQWGCDIVMNADWIIDVLSDLQTFARANDLAVLAEHLDDVAIVALAEIVSQYERAMHERQDASP